MCNRTVITGCLAIMLLIVAAGPASALLQARLPKYLGPASVHNLQVKPQVIVWTGDGSGLFAGRGAAPRRGNLGRLHWTKWSGKRALVSTWG